MAEKEIAVRVSIKGDPRQQKALNDLQTSVDKLTRERKKLNDQERKGLITAKEASRRRAELNLQLKATRNNLRDVEAQILKNNKALRKNSGFVSGIRKALKPVGVAFAAAFSVQTIARFANDAIKRLKDFEQQLARVKAITGASDEEFKRLQKSAVDLGKTSQFTATQVGKLQEEFAKLGFSTNEILSATEATLNLATATQSDLSQAAEVAASTIKAFGLTAKDTTRITDVMAASFSGSALDINRFQTAMAIVGPAAKSAGASVEETTAILGKIIDAGVDASSAGTALRNIFLDLAKSGMTFEEAMTQINGATNKNATALELFGKRGAVVSSIIAENTENIKDFTGELEKSEGAAKEMADIVGNTLEGATKRLDSAWEGLVLSFSKSGGVLKDTTDSLADLLNMISAAETTSQELDALGFERGGLFGTGFGTFDSGGLNQIINGVRKASTDAERTAETLFRIRNTIRKGIEAELENPERLDEIAAGYAELAEEVKRTGKAAGDETGENAQAFRNLYLMLAEEAKTAAADTRDAVEKARIAEKKAEEDRKKARKIEAEEKAKEDAKEAAKLAKKVEAERNHQLDLEKIRAEFRLSELEKQKKFAEIEIERRRKELEEAGLSEVEIVQAIADKKLEIEKDYQEKKKKEQQKALDDLEKELLKEADVDRKKLEKKKDEEKKEREEAAKQRVETEKALVSQLEQIAGQSFALFEARIERRKELELANLDARLENGLISQEQFEQQRLQIEKDAFEKKKKLDTTNAIINGAVAITKTIAQLGGVGAVTPAGVALIASIAAGTAIQTGIIQSQKFAKGGALADTSNGGVLNGRSHNEGGIPFTVNGRPGFEAEGDEIILTKGVFRDPVLRQQASDLNVAGGGVAFANGGPVPNFRKFRFGGVANSQASNNTSSADISAAIASALNSLKVYNVASDTAIQAGKINNIQSEANFSS